MRQVGWPPVIFSPPLLLACRKLSLSLSSKVALQATGLGPWHVDEKLGRLETFSLDWLQAVGAAPFPPGELYKISMRGACSMRTPAVTFETGAQSWPAVLSLAHITTPSLTN